MIDLRNYGQPIMFEPTGSALDLSKIDEMKIRVIALKCEFMITFKERDKMDEFISLFTGSRNNIKI